MKINSQNATTDELRLTVQNELNNLLVGKTIDEQTELLQQLTAFINILRSNHDYRS